MEQDREFGLERLQKVVLDYLHLHVFRNLLVEFILGQKGIWTMLKVPESILPPLVNNLSRDFFVCWQLSPHFDYEVLDHLYHVVGVFTSWDIVGLHEGLHFLNGHWVEQHADELDYTDHEWFCGVALGRWDVSVATCWKRGCDEIDSNNVLLIEVELINTMTCHPRPSKVLPSLTEHDLGAG